MAPRPWASPTEDSSLLPLRSGTNFWAGGVDGRGGVRKSVVLSIGVARPATYAVAF